MNSLNVCTADNPICAKRPSYNPDFYFKSMYTLGLHLSDELFYQITVPISTETEQISDDVCLWSDELSDELLYKVTAQL